MIALYLVSAVAGVSFMGLSALLGHFGSGHDHGGDGHGGDSGHDGFSLPFFSPLAIAAYVTGFGSSGLMLTQGLGLTSPYLHVPGAVLCAGVFGVGMLAAVAKLTQKTEGNTLPSLQDAVGTEVEVTIAIPAGGTGEVAYVAGGTRQTGLACAEAGQSFPQGARVKVTRAAEGTLHVTHAAAATLASGNARLGEPVEAPPPQREKVR